MENTFAACANDAFIIINGPIQKHKENVVAEQFFKKWSKL